MTNQIMVNPIEYIAYDGEWAIKVIGNKLLIQKDGEKRVYLVVRDEKVEYVYKILKTRVKAADGAEGLARFLVRNKDTGLVRRFVRSVWNECKEARA